MTEKYEIKTYGMGRTMLDAGWYTAQDLIKVIEGMGMLNQHARAQIDAVMLSSDPAGLKPKAKREERMSYEELETDRDRMKTARDSLMLSNANLKAENYELKNRQPEQEPVAMYEDWYNTNSCGHCGMVGGHTKTCRHYTTPPQRTPPQFPTMLRKMWSGKEVQEWINQNWK